MAGTGPAPKPNSVRSGRGLSQPLMVLPSEGRQGDPPPWPLQKTNPFEQELWAKLWVTPQAVAWERMGMVRLVARYCRLLFLAELPDAFNTSGLLPEVRQLEDRLGLSPMAMMRLRWQIAPDEVAEKREDRTADVRKRLRAVETA